MSVRSLVSHDLYMQADVVKTAGELALPVPLVALLFSRGMTNEKDNGKVTSKKVKTKRLGGIAAFSLLISLFDRLGEIIYDAFINGFFGRIFTSHKKLRNKLSNGFFVTYVIKNSKIRKFFREIRRF